MRRYAIFLTRFALAPIVSGTFVVSAAGHASPVESAHVFLGFTLLLLTFSLLWFSLEHKELRLPSAVALILALLETIPGVPQFHALVSPLLFAALVWAAVRVNIDANEAARGRRKILLLPALVLAPIYFGVGFRHQTSGFVAHLSAAMVAACVIFVFCLVVSENKEAEKTLRRVANLTIAALVFQFTAGAVTLMLRMLDLQNGLSLAVARAAHITGAAPLLGAVVTLTMIYRRRAA